VRDPLQHHALEALEIVEAVLGRGLHGREQRRARIVADHAEQAAQDARKATHGVGADRGEVGRERGRQSEQRDFVGERIARRARAPARGAMYYFFLLGFFAIFSTTISKTPVLPLFSQAMGAGDALIGLIAVFSPLAGILFSFPMGVLSDHLGRKRLLVASGAVFLLAPFLYLLVSDPAWLIPVRFFHGTATAILGPVVSAIIAERFPVRKGEMLGQYSSATLVGRALDFS